MRQGQVSSLQRRELLAVVTGGSPVTSGCDHCEAQMSRSSSSSVLWHLLSKLLAANCLLTKYPRCGMSHFSRNSWLFLIGSNLETRIWAVGRLTAAGVLTTCAEHFQPLSGQTAKLERTQVLPVLGKQHTQPQEVLCQGHQQCVYRGRELVG
ncbi:hypothetical protein Cadr_000018522 [Camelus dromedarius]|uniref:Uncharacterized protein n=1 Tax=Camelus dromedarius TaxID=9838 RepID=A0A5N4D2B4_CAMDR|nr:hypothetical protein Cadr_000018522 [Camelus dromedarius]